ncbi:MAG: hypothetical protein ACKOX6_05485 [Bdellovibrio sp.]
MIKKQMILLILGLFATLPTLAETCTPSANNCEYYRCMERSRSCGRNGYWQDFAIPYCQKFVDDNAKFNTESQRWLRDVRECLQVRLGEVSANSTCNQIKDAAMDSHVGCYVDTGFCSLAAADQIKVMWYLKGAIRDWRTWKEADLLRQACFQRGFR